MQKQMSIAATWSQPNIAHFRLAVRGKCRYRVHLYMYMRGDDVDEGRCNHSRTCGILDLAEKEVQVGYGISSKAMKVNFALQVFPV